MTTFGERWIDDVQPISYPFRFTVTDKNDLHWFRFLMFRGAHAEQPS
jgi:hypothetical protein